MAEESNGHSISGGLQERLRDVVQRLDEKMASGQLHDTLKRLGLRPEEMSDRFESLVGRLLEQGESAPSTDEYSRENRDDGVTGTRRILGAGCDITDDAARELKPTQIRRFLRRERWAVEDDHWYKPLPQPASSENHTPRLAIIDSRSLDPHACECEDWSDCVRKILRSIQRADPKNRTVLHLWWSIVNVEID